MDEQSYLTEELQARIGVESSGTPQTISSELIERLSDRLADGAAPIDSRVPQSLLLVLGTGNEFRAVSTLPKQSIVSGNQWTWQRPFRLGETLRGVSRIADAYERFSGNLGHALFLRNETVYLDADDQPVASAQLSIAYYAGERARQRDPEPPANVLPPPPAPADLPPGADPRRATEGDPLAARLVTPSLTEVRRFAGTAGAMTPIFTDPEAARAAGLPGPILPGPLKIALLTEMVLAWAGPDAFLESIRVAYRRPDLTGRPLLLGGGVTSAREEAGTRRLECEVWIQQLTGQRSSVGSATLRLPAG